MIKEQIAKFVKDNVELICELPSVTMYDSNVRLHVPGSHYDVAVPKDILCHPDVVVEDIVPTVNTAKASIVTGYNLLRRKATEIMVWVLTNKNRNSSLEIPCSLPIAFGLKDYKLSSSEMREATEHVLMECKNRGIHVVSFSTDGQWIPLMRRDADSHPLTIYQLQKDVWESTKSISKADLIKRISALNKCDSTIDAPLSHISIVKMDDGGVGVRSIDGTAFEKIKTSHDKKTVDFRYQRGFRMRTSRSSGVYPQYSGEQNEPTVEIHMYLSMEPVIKPRDHEFDRREKNAKKQIRFGSIAEPSAPSRGALAVRQWHRKDESKILPTKRLGLSIDDI